MKQKLNKKLVELIFKNYNNRSFTLSEIMDLKTYGMQTILSTCLGLNTYVFKSGNNKDIRLLSYKKINNLEYIFRLNLTSTYILYEILDVDLPIEKEIDLTTPLSDSPGYVYCYYYQSYKDLAEYNDVYLWNCKIGQTSRFAPLLRINDQLNASTPEKPVVALIIKCDNPLAVEQYLHNYFKIHNRFINNYFNKEWFMTNPDEVESLIINAIKPIKN